MMHRRGLIYLYIAASVFLIVLLVLFFHRDVPNEKAAIKVAIVVDDWGYNLNNIDILDSIEIPLTLATLPNLAYSSEIGSLMQQHPNREIILHMPMEPDNDSLRLEEDTLLNTMDSVKISSLIGSAFKSAPFARGMSNHMGSKVTRNREVMGVIMKDLRSRSMFFLDSVAVSDTICEQSAKDYEVAFVRRDVFLDNITDKEYISAQFDQLIAIALKKGSAVGIGHDRSLTLEVIKEKSSQLENSNIEFVLVSDLASVVDQSIK